MLTGRIESRCVYTGPEILSKWRTAYAPDTGSCVRETATHAGPDTYSSPAGFILEGRARNWPVQFDLLRRCLCLLITPAFSSPPRNRTLYRQFSRLLGLWCERKERRREIIIRRKEARSKCGSPLYAWIYTYIYYSSLKFASKLKNDVNIFWFITYQIVINLYSKVSTLLYISFSQRVDAIRHSFGFNLARIDHWQRCVLCVRIEVTLEERKKERGRGGEKRRKSGEKWNIVTIFLSETKSSGQYVSSVRTWNKLAAIASGVQLCRLYGA